MPKARRSGGGSGPFADSPWWVRAAVYFGAPTIFAAYFAVNIVNDFKANQTTTNTLMTLQQKALTDLVSHLNEETARSARQQDAQWVQLGVLQRICMSVGKTEQDRTACTLITGRPQP